MEFVKYLKSFVKWIVIAVIVGLVGGSVGSIFHIAIDYATEIRMKSPWVIYLLPVGGILIAAFYHLARKKGHIDTNRVLEAVRKDEKVPLVMAPLIFVSTVITHLLGGSAGREGAALQLGGSIGYNVGKVFRFKNSDMHIIVMAGMSAVFAALFGTPMTAAFFSIEVVSVGIMHYAAIVPCVISAVLASQTALLAGLHPVRFDLVAIPSVSAPELLRIIILALLCAAVSIAFCWMLEKVEHYMNKFISGKFSRAFAGGMMIVFLTVLVGTYDYNGAGMDIISRAILGEARWEAFAIKILFTAITIGAGFKGGEIVPAFFIGSTFGCVIGTVMGIDPGFAAAIGFVSLFCGAVNCPVASLLLSIEVFGAEGLIFFAIACGISYMMSGKFGLYKSQELIYSKILDEVIGEKN